MITRSVAKIRQSSALATAGVGWAHESRSSEVPNDEPEAVQRGVKGAWLIAHLARSRPEFALHGQRETGTQSHL